MATLFVGEAPTRHATRGPLSGRTGTRLAKMAGVTLDEFLDSTMRLNLFDAPIGEWDRGVRAAARERADAIREAATAETSLILLGRHVCAAFGLPRRAPWFVAVDLEPGTAWPVPHPSGRSRFYNDAANRERAESYFHALLAGLRS